MRLLFLTPFVAALVAAPAAAQGCITDDFETFNIGVGSATNTGAAYVDDLAVVAGQGPGLVQDGCTYTMGAGGGLQWNGDTYYSLVSKTICSSGSNFLTIDYDQPVGQVDMDLSAFSGYADTATVVAYDGAGATLVTQVVAIAGNGAQHPVSLTAAGIEQVVVSGTYSWSPMIDNHQYCPGGPQLALSGTCGQGGSGVTGSGYTAGGVIALAYSFQAGAWVVPNGGCAGAQLGIIVPTLVGFLPADGNGDFSYLLPNGIPNGACGAVHAQAVDVATCTPSNVLSL